MYILPAHSIAFDFIVSAAFTTPSIRDVRTVLLWLNEFEQIVKDMIPHCDLESHLML
jgi:hypothetical protein